MLTIKDIKDANSIYKIPKDIHLNRNIVLDYRLLNALENPDPLHDLKYDFDVFLPRYGINLQRPYVWEHTQQNEFILSILMERPIDSFIAVEIVNWLESDKPVIQIIDGKQRLITIQRFVHNEFPITINGKEYFWNDFEEELKQRFRSRVGFLTATVYYSYDDTPVTDDMKIILFNYYNFSGSEQTEQHKNKLQNLLGNGQD